MRERVGEFGVVEVGGFIGEVWGWRGRGRGNEGGGGIAARIESGRDFGATVEAGFDKEPGE